MFPRRNYVRYHRGAITMSSRPGGLDNPDLHDYDWVLITGFGKQYGPGRSKETVNNDNRTKIQNCSLRGKRHALGVAELAIQTGDLNLCTAFEETESQRMAKSGLLTRTRLGIYWISLLR
jgi:hypothetical protein